MFYKNSKLGNFLHYNHPAAEARFAGFEQIPVGFQQIQVGQNEDGSPIYGDGDTIYEDGDPLFLLVGWNEAWGEPPTDEELEAWEEPEPEPPAPLTDVEIAAERMAARRQAREDVIFSDKSGLVGKCYAWLQRPCVVSGQEGTSSKTAGEALLAGQDLCSTYGNQMRRWIDFAAPDFFTSMSSPDPARPWLEWVPEGVGKSIREAILDAIYLATYGVART